jgi:hypothetical protein
MCACAEDFYTVFDDLTLTPPCKAPRLEPPRDRARSRTCFGRPAVRATMPRMDRETAQRLFEELTEIGRRLRAAVEVVSDDGEKKRLRLDAVEASIDASLGVLSQDHPSLRPSERPWCSFCAKPQDEVKKLVSGAAAFICNECIGLCMEMMEGAQLAEEAAEDENGPISSVHPSTAPKPG